MSTPYERVCEAISTVVRKRIKGHEITLQDLQAMRAVVDSEWLNESSAAFSEGMAKQREADEHIARITSG